MALKPANSPPLSTVNVLHHLGEVGNNLRPLVVKLGSDKYTALAFLWAAMSPVSFSPATILLPCVQNVHAQRFSSKRLTMVANDLYYSKSDLLLKKMEYHSPTYACFTLERLTYSYAKCTRGVSIPINHTGLQYAWKYRVYIFIIKQVAGPNLNAQTIFP